MAKKKRKLGETDGGEMMSVGDIAKMLGVEANSVHHMIARDSTFPSPMKDSVKAAHLYKRSAVMRWAKKTKRMK